MFRLKNKKNVTYLEFFLVFLLFVSVSSIVVLASVPPISRDALTHHLALPKLYLKHGDIYEIPFMRFSYYPMNLDLLYLIPLYFENDIVPKSIHFSFAILTAWLIFNYLKRRTNIVYALTGALFFLSIPIIVKLSITVYVDLGLIFFSTASLLLLLRWMEKGFPLKLLVLSASFCGLALGTKYNCLITLFLLTLFVPFVYSRYAEGGGHGFFRPVGYGMLFLFVALLLFSPWMIRNYLWTNNPLFPLYDNWFNPQDAMDRQTIGIFTYRSLQYHETWWQIALLPVRIFFQGQDGNPQYFDGRINPFLLFLPFFAFYRIGKDPDVIRNEKKIMLVFGFLFFAFAFFTTGLRIRYISPIIPPLVILSVLGLRKMVEAASRFSSQSVRNVGLAVILLMLSFALSLNAHYILGQYEYVDPFSYLSGTLTRDGYIEKYRLEYPAMRYINENLPPDVRILFIYLGKRGYYCDRAYILDMNRNRSMLGQLVKMSDKPEKIVGGLKEMGITHLLINYDILNKWVKDNFTIKEQELLGEFFEKHTRLDYLKWGYGVSRLGYFD